jgi:hypothetical protein
LRFSAYLPLRRSSLKLERRECLEKNSFQKMLNCTRKRAARSGRVFLLMSVNVEPLLQAGQSDQDQSTFISALCHSTRDTDTIGWHRELKKLGVIFAEIYTTGGKVAVDAIRAKVTAALRTRLDSRLIDQIDTEFLVLPEASD